MCYESASGYVPFDNVWCCWGCGMALSYPCSIIQVGEDSDSLFGQCLTRAFWIFVKTKGADARPNGENWKNKTLPLPLYCPTETKKRLVRWKYVHMVIPQFIVELKKPITQRENVTRCLNVLIFELGDSQVLINISEIQDQPFLATIPNYPQGADNMNIRLVSLCYTTCRKQFHDLLWDKSLLL